MAINITDLKKKIIYRSTYRGTKEMDKLLSSFVAKNIDKLLDNELFHLCDLLDNDDVNLYKLNQGQETSIKFINNRVTNLFKDFIYKKE